MAHRPRHTPLSEPPSILSTLQRGVCLPVTGHPLPNTERLSLSSARPWPSPGHARTVQAYAPRGASQVCQLSPQSNPWTPVQDTAEHAVPTPCIDRLVLVAVMEEPRPRRLVTQAIAHPCY